MTFKVCLVCCASVASNARTCVVCGEASFDEPPPTVRLAEVPTVPTADAPDGSTPERRKRRR